MPYATVALYLRLVRKHRGLSQDAVAQRLGVHHRQVWRWEKAENEPTATFLIGFADTVGASIIHLHYLMGPTTTDDDAQQLAQALSDGQQTLPATLTGWAPLLSDQDRSLLVALATRFQHDHRALHLWLGYGQRLADEDQR